MLGQLYSTLKLFLLIVLLCFGAGCGSSEQVVVQPPIKPQEAPKIVERKLPLKEYEATLNPSDFDQTVEVVQRMHEAEQHLQHLDIPIDSTVIEEVVTQGFRIQIYSSSNIQEATDAKMLAVGKLLQDSVYLLYDAPVYKVRVGDFISRYEAGQKLPDIVDLGYRDAWIVPDKIVQRKKRVVAPAPTPR